MKKSKFIAVGGLLVGLLAINGTMAWMFDNSSITNTFTPAKVEGEIDEGFTGEEKTDVSIINKSDIPVYIRVALVPTWMDRDNPTALATDGTYNMKLNLEDRWVQKGDFYYYTEVVQPGDKTDVLVKSCKPNTGLPKVYDDKDFRLEVIASLIQAEPTEVLQGEKTPIEEAWGVDFK